MKLPHKIKMMQKILVNRMIPFGSIATYGIHRLMNRAKVRPPQPVLIVGCGHSGTTLLRAILGAHPNIYAYPHESYMMFEGIYHAQRMASHYTRLAFIQRARVWVEKTPRHIHYLAPIFSIWPNAKVIVMIRDGRDVAVSTKKRGRGVRSGIDRWVNDNKEAQRFWDHPNVHILRYEQLVEDFESTLTSALHFIGEEYHPACKEHHKTQAQKTMPSKQSGKSHQEFRDWQIAQPLFDGRGKWKKLDDEEKQLIKEVAGSMLIEYGYADDTEW